MQEMKQRIRQDFNKASVSYDKYARLQQQVAARVFVLALEMLHTKSQVLDVGCGTGYIAQHAAKRWQMFQCDLAESMCEKALHLAPAVAADAESLPFADNTLDGVLSSLTLQWVSPVPAFSEIRRVLKPNGLMIASTLGENTLHELRKSFAAAVGVAPVMNFYTADKLSAACKESGLHLEEFFDELVIHDYEDIFTLLASIKGIGGRYKSGTGRAGVSRRYFEALAEAYIKFFGKISATWEVQYIIARKR
jgi:malonyl-CoA O-methyltransferase